MWLFRASAGVGGKLLTSRHFYFYARCSSVGFKKANFQERVGQKVSCESFQLNFHINLNVIYRKLKFNFQEIIF